MFDQKFHWNVSEIAIFLEYENPQILFYWPFFRFIKVKYGKKIKQHEMKNNYNTYTPKICQILEVFTWINFNKHKPLISEECFHSSSFAVLKKNMFLFLLIHPVWRRSFRHLNGPGVPLLPKESWIKNNPFNGTISGSDQRSCAYDIKLVFRIY